MRNHTLIGTIPIHFLSNDRQKCCWISIAVIIQSLTVYMGSFTILNCKWTLDKASMDFDKLARIMYLYDPEACGYNLQAAKTVTNLQFSNDTKGFDVLPIKWKPAIVTVSTRLSAKTRRYIELSLGAHVIWMISAIILRIFIRRATKFSLIKLSLAIFFYTSVFIVFFDLSMAIVYITHIQQSLSKGMILRYSGWSVELQLRSYDDFAGWLPITASICWLRGVIIFGLNIYMCKIIYYIRLKIKKKEVLKKIKLSGYLPIPEAKTYHQVDNNVLYYRAGEHTPYVNKSMIHKIFY